MKKFFGRSNIIIDLLAIMVIVSIIITLSTNHQLKDYKMREINRMNYQASNYTVIGELYATTPEGVKIIQDVRGNLWEAPGLYEITRQDILVLEIENNELSKIMVVAWVKEDYS